MDTFKQKGERIAYTNATSSAISAGDVVVIGAMIGIAVDDIAVGAAGVLEVCHVHNLAATAADDWAQGAQLYWVTATAKLTDTAGSNTKAGRAAAAKAAAATTATVLLNSNA